MAVPQHLKHRRRFAAVLFALALALRVGVAWHLGLDAPPTPGSDEQEYVTYATSLATSGEYRGMSPDVADQHHLTAYRTPGTSLVYAALFRMFGRNFTIIRLTNCLWGAISCLLLLAIGRQVTTEPAAWLAAAGWAVYPRSLYFSASLLSEPLALLVFLGFILVALRFARTRRPWLALSAGLLLGFAILVHPARVFVLPFVMIWLWMVFRRDARMLVVGSAIPAVALLTLVPWAVRNYAVFHRVIPLTTGGGSALLQGNNRIVVTDPKYFGYSIWDTAIPEYAAPLRAAGNEFSRDSIAKKFAVEWISSHRRDWPFLVGAKLVRGFTPFLQPGTPAVMRWGELLAWGPVLVLLLIGFIPTWMQMPVHGRLIHLASLHYVAVTALFFGNSRYRYPVEPLFLLIAAMTLLWLLQRWRRTPAVA